MSERDAVIDAIKATPNLGVAAKRLGASRRTLQNRMREFGLPHGRDGRPRTSLPQGGSNAGSIALLVAAGAGAFFAGRWLFGTSAGQVVAGDAASDYLDGTSILASL